MTPAETLAESKQLDRFLGKAVTEFFDDHDLSNGQNAMQALYDFEYQAKQREELSREFAEPAGF